MQNFDMGRAPAVSFGVDRIRDVPEIAAGMGKGAAFIIADAFLGENGVTDRLSEGFRAKGVSVEVAADIAGEPKEALVDLLSARAREMDAQVIIGLGGGAAMDAAKLVAAIARSGRPARDFALAANPFPADAIPAIAVPTTAGTGSEVTRTSIVSNQDGTKNWFWGEELMFSHAVLDPQLTVSLPSKLTAWTGIDAVAHALEASTARTTSEAGRLYGRQALRMLASALPRAVADGADIDARGDMLWASMVAGLALHNCNTHMGHNVSHALGSLARIHHGLATGLALEVTLPWLTARPDGADDYAQAAEALGGPSEAGALPDVFASLMRAAEIPASLPAECADVTAEALAAAMKSGANIGMAGNAACDIGAADLDEMAAMMMGLEMQKAA